MSDIPGVNPYLPIERELVVKGFDEMGMPVCETLQVTVRPSYYFWLGADAYPDWPIVTRLSHNLRA